MRLFSQSFSGEVKKWFRTLPIGSIIKSQHFENIFLNKWEEKKNLVQLLTQYNQLKRGNDEATKNFSDRFNKIYNSLPVQCKPLEEMAKLHYAEGFDDDFSLLLRERRSTTLEDMMNDAIEVEVTLMASKKGKYRFYTKKVKEEVQPSISQSTADSQIDSMLKVMERMMEILAENDSRVVKEQNEPQIRNPNFRKPRKQGLPPPQILQRGQRNHNYNQIDQVRPPFQENLLDEDFSQQIEDHINLFGDKESKVFLTKEEHDRCAQDFDESKLEDEYQRGYQNTMGDFQRQMDLRNKAIQISNLPTKNIADQASTSKSHNTTTDKEKDDKKKSQNEVVRKQNPKEKVSEELLQKEALNKDVPERNDSFGDAGKKHFGNKKELALLEKFSPSTSFEIEIAKVKIYLPFSEILKNSEYRSQIGKMLKVEDSSDTVNLQDHKPTIMFGPRVESSQEDDVPPFYISLRIHNFFLQNAMLDSGASHNLMPKIIMDNLILDITRPYKDLYSFDSRKVRCLGLIKYLVVSLHQMPEKSIVMDVVVADVLVKFGMLLSRSWAAKLKVTLQMDMSYATIPLFGEQRRLYRENRLAYMISSPTHPENHPIYSAETNLGSAIFCNDIFDE